MTIRELIRKKVLGVLGIVNTEHSVEDINERLTFINDSERLTRTRIREFNVWYEGDGDELLNFYTRQNTIDYNFEPWYSRNKKSYFWSISSTEEDIKRTHSGQPRNIIDTMVNITRFPLIESKSNPELKKILADCKLSGIYKKKQLPLTLVEGWGCYKINWDLDFSDYPFPIYYRAENVDFVYKDGKIISIIYKDYYTDGESRKYLLIETRTRKYSNTEKRRFLEIRKELYRAETDGDFVTPIDLENVGELIPELKGMKNQAHLELYVDSLLSAPCIIFENTAKSGGPGRSVFTGKIDLFDDLDQCLSQGSNTVRRSTVMEYFNSDFLERDPKTGMPRQPKAYDRKYSMYKGQRDANGSPTSTEPVQVTQPQVNFEQYSSQAISILMEIMNGVMSPATLGIDISKKDNAEAQREKEKVTIFTRNAIIDEETEILREVCDNLLWAYEFIKTGSISTNKHDISIKWSEFADDSYENKLEVLGAAYDASGISDEMYMQKLYGNTLSEEEWESEIAWLKENHTKPRTEGMQGAAFGEMANEEENY